MEDSKRVTELCSSQGGMREAQNKLGQGRVAIAGASGLSS